MSTPGGQSEESWEQRIRPAPRAARPARPPEAPQSIERLPHPPPASDDSSAPAKPDRSRMDPLSLDRSTSRKLSRLLRGEIHTRTRHQRSRRLDRWLMLWIVLLLAAAMAGGVVWLMRQRLDLATGTQTAMPVGTRAAALSGDRVLAMLQAFLLAPHTPAKAAYVLDSTRVLPLMVKAYQKGGMPEASLQLGVPQPLDHGVWAVPAKAPGPPEFLLHLIIREVQGEPRLDWETFAQEIGQRFTAFVAVPGTAGREFRLVLERAHAFAAGPDESVAVRIAAPGNPALADPVTVRAEIAPALSDALPWNRRRRALVRLEWQTPPGGTPRLLLTEVVKWEFIP